ncbi:MAG: M48 family metallopeptidase [Lachnospiraceae bacterium]|nr:M48 family metallopeptidase [Lachnospiraceae bacterium]
MKVKKEYREVRLSTGTLPYTLERKKVKNMILRIKLDGSVWVSAPRRVPIYEVERFLRQEEDYIQRKQLYFDREREKKRPPLQLVDGEQIYYLGRLMTLRVREWPLEAVWIEGDELCIQVSDRENLERKKELLQSWYRDEMQSIFSEMIDQVYARFEPYGVEYPVVKIRSMTSRWGSCTPQKKKITLNSYLIFQPLSSIEYVVVHEFAHFIHLNHSKEFWTLVEEILPDYKERKRRLSLDRVQGI